MTPLPPSRLVLSMPEFEAMGRSSFEPGPRFGVHRLGADRVELQLAPDQLEPARAALSEAMGRDVVFRPLYF